MKHLLDYLTLFYQASRLPLHYYQDGECILEFPVTEIHSDSSYILRELLENRKNGISYFIHDFFVGYGLAEGVTPDRYLIVGPIVTAPLERSRLPEIMHKLSIPAEAAESVWDFFKTQPLLSITQLLNYLCLFHLQFTGELLSPQDYLFNDSDSSIEERHGAYLASFHESLEAEQYHNTWRFEQELYHHVESGNLSAVTKILEDASRLVPGKVSRHSLRQEQNILVANLTNIARSAIRGGLDIETAYQLSDTYILQSEQADTVQVVQRLQYEAIIDYTRRVSAQKIPAGMSADVYNSIQYISTHVNAPISVEDVAIAVGKSRSYLSKKFKQELGFSLGDYIMRRKLEEAKSLLTYTDKTISEISSYLCFSSQSYFQNVFKKKYRITPHEYRLKHSAHLSGHPSPASD